MTRTTVCAELLTLANSPPSQQIDLGQWQIQDFPQGGAPIPELGLFCQFFAKNCMKMKEFGPPGGGGRASLAPPLDPPMWAAADTNIFYPQIYIQQQTENQDPLLNSKTTTRKR